MHDTPHPVNNGIRTRVVGLLALLFAGNAAAWLWALASFHTHPVLLGTALLAYMLGLRHAVDADHIAAIDNVTRKLVQRGGRPVTVGFWFSIGHSAIVFALSGAVVLGSVALEGRFGALSKVGRVLGTAISAAFLLVLAAANLAILASVYRRFRRVREGGPDDGEPLDAVFAGGGLGRLLKGLFGLIDNSWQMFPVGLLFGLGFDTATEVALLGISALEATRGLPSVDLMVFPALFAAGMVLVDSADSLLMLGAYGWAFVHPLRRLYYNLSLTAVSVLVAILVGGLEVLGLIADEFGLKGRLWDWVGALNGHFGVMGVATAAFFAFSWLVAAAVYRWRGYDKVRTN